MTASESLTGTDGEYLFAGLAPRSVTLTFSAVTIDPGERSGTFDITMHPFSNSPTPPGVLRLSGSFNCPVSHYAL